jgi:hypothetical protein
MRPSKSQDFAPQALHLAGLEVVVAPKVRYYGICLHAT